MTLGIRLFIFIIGTFLFITILELVRRRKFREELSIIWIFVGFGLMLSSLADMVIDPLARRLGISYPPALITIFIFFVLILGTLYFSIVVSDLKGKIKELGQKIALLEYRISKNEQK